MENTISDEVILDLLDIVNVVKFAVQLIPKLPEKLIESLDPSKFSVGLKFTHPVEVFLYNGLFATTL